MKTHALSLALVALALGGCTPGSSGRSGAASATAPSTSSGAAVATQSVVVLQIGSEVPGHVALRVEDLLRQSSQRPIEVRGASAGLAGLASGSLVIGLGETTATRALIAAGEPAPLGAEGFVVRAGDVAPGVRVVAADGNPAGPGAHAHGVNRGLLYGTYALLEELGFAFLHPLDPTEPSELSRPAAGLELREAPHWPQRAIHLHTMHPLELTDLLNGWGPQGPQDAAGWRAQLPEWETYCEWLIANRQNEVEWVLLSAKSWEAFADGPVRQQRLSELVRLSQAWGISTGIDVPLALQQQHAWRLVRQTGTLADEERQIRDRLDYVLGCGFDFASTELGFSEFTKPDDQRMLDWMNAFARHLQAQGKGAYVKAHISQGQTAQSFPDPRTGQPINFNFLSHYADPHLGVYAHTVQHYALDDPAPTYGATDFGFIRDFIHLETRARPLLWYPETAYWVSFDIDVPLFLPVYADRRVRDLRLLAQDEQAGRMGPGERMKGQSIFSSGWEWGYWLNDVVTARGAWEPNEGAASDREALRRSLAPVARPFGPAAADVVDVLLRICDAQRELLIFGELNGQRPADIERRNGQAYLQGWETWDDLNEFAKLLPIPGLGPMTTQPTRRGLIDLRRGRFSGVDYGRELRPLLVAMRDRFEPLAAELEQLVPRAPAHARSLLRELAQAMRVTALRARQTLGLYDYVDADDRARLADARRALDEAQALVVAREAEYRVPADRIAGWRENPTAYPYGYLWTARRLVYWWRDEGKAVDAPWSPAYLNTLSPLDVAFGEGLWTPAADLVRALGPALGVAAVTDLFAAPDREPTFPPAGLRQRP